MEICVRTERPAEAVVHQSRTIELGDPPSWSNVTGSMSDFFRKLDRLDTRSPVTQMWLDGHHFFEEPGYKISEDAKFKNIQSEHWKISRLKQVLKEEYADDKLHSMNRPPLWMAPGTKVEKHLVFSEYKFLPGEISSELNYGTINDSKLFKGSHLGYFPSDLKSSKRRSEEQAEIQKSIHWIYFYPWLSFEDGSSPKLRQIELDQILNKCDNLVEAVFLIEEHFCSKIPEKMIRLTERRKWMGGLPSAEIKRGAKRDLEEIFTTRNPRPNSPGTILAVTAYKMGLTKDSEHPLLEVANALLKLFASPEAQLIGKHWLKGRKRSKHESTHRTFAIWYCNRYRLGDVLAEYFSLMQENGASAGDALREAASAIGLKRSGNGSRCARPFQDKKEVVGSSYESDKDLSPKSLRNAFNSPFPPYVLVSTSVGQEGLDFHRYCDRVIHWSPPSSPSVMQQREGRVDRFKSLQNRKAMNQDWESDPLGMSPDFVVLDRDQKRLNRTQRFVMALPYSSQAARWKKCVQRLYYNDLLIGVPDPLAVEKRFEALLSGLSDNERRLRLEEFNSLCVSLRPNGGKISKRKSA